jgi:hydantoinase/carbamoylase family amidase
MGNIFAIYPGQDPSLAPIGMGSHLDTQPAGIPPVVETNPGGKYDGILGVTAALEVLRTIHASGLKLHAPIAAIDWTNEEGARFPKMCCASSVWSGSQTVQAQHALEDLGGVDMKSELQRIGFLGKEKCSYFDMPLSAHFELHIEQGPILEKEGKKIGVVGGVQAMRWYKVTCTGREGHAGATPMDNRADALLAAAKLITKVNTSSIAHGAVGTVGIVKTETEAVNTIVGSAWFSIDLRCPHEHELDTIEAELKDRANELSAEGVIFTFKQTWECPAVRFDEVALQCVREAAQEYAGPEMCREMDSAAGHDSAETSMRVPTAMIFVPSKDGISHNPNEYTSKKEWYVRIDEHISF